MSSDRCTPIDEYTPPEFTGVVEVTSSFMSSQLNATAFNLFVVQTTELRSPFPTSSFPLPSTNGVPTTDPPEVDGVVGDGGGNAYGLFPYEVVEKLIDRIVVITVCALGLLC